jgi:hypothetical protein
MKEFNLKLALDGAKVVDDKGNVWKYAAYNPEAKEPYQLIFWDNEGIGRASDIKGNVGTCTRLFMAPTERKEWIVRGANGDGIFGPYAEKAHAESSYLVDQGGTIHEITIIE